jgi:hypothetical protein
MIDDDPHAPQFVPWDIARLMDDLIGQLRRRVTDTPDHRLSRQSQELFSL